MDRAARHVPQRAINRWTLEPIAFLVPFLLTVLSVFALAVSTISPGGFVGFSLVILFVALIGASFFLTLRKKR